MSTQQEEAAPFETGATESNGAGGESLPQDFEGCETADQPPKSGEYDFTVSGASVDRSKQEGSGAVGLATQVLVANAQGNPFVRDWLMMVYKDGETVVGSPSDPSRRGNLAVGLCKNVGVPTAVLKQIGPVTELIGKTGRAYFTAKTDKRDNSKQLRFTRFVERKATDADADVAAAEAAGL